MALKYEQLKILWKHHGSMTTIRDFPPISEPSATSMTRDSRIGSTNTKGHVVHKFTMTLRRRKRPSVVRKGTHR
ncbi:hypothetical protein SLA2020_425220 [Shorea laevis]